VLAARRSSRPAARVETQYATRRPWVPAPAWVGRWSHAALRGARASGRLCVRVVAPAESRRLNRAYRGKDQPTNVLSFPASPAERQLARALGDVVICAAVVAREAREQRKMLREHWAHMVVHGTLHLLGYDHAGRREATRMEGLETRILRGFGYPDPYRAHATRAQEPRR
jgi:probable rRNA maturation factor